MISITGLQIFLMAVAAGAGFACGFVPVKMLLEWGLREITEAAFSG
jgi:hypothetical protein